MADSVNFAQQLLDNLKIGIYYVSSYGDFKYKNIIFDKVFNTHNCSQEIIFKLLFPSAIINQIDTLTNNNFTLFYCTFNSSNEKIAVKNNLKIIKSNDFIEYQGTIEEINLSELISYYLPILQAESLDEFSFIKLEEDKFIFLSSTIISEINEQINYNIQNLVIDDKKMREEIYKIVFDTISQGVIYHDKEGKIIVANIAAEKLLGISLSKMLGKKPYELQWKRFREDGTDFPEDEYPSSYSLKTGKPLNGIIMGIFNPVIDDTVWLSVNSAPLYLSGNDTPDFVFVSFYDFTDKKKNIEALKKSEDLYRTFINANSDFVFLKDENFRYILINSKFEKFLGLTENEIIGKSDFEILPMENANNCFKSDSLAVKSKTPHVSYETFNGKYYRATKFPVNLSQNRTGVGGYLRDVTKEQMIESELMVSEHNFKMIVENLTDLVVRVNLDGRFLFVSPTYCELFGKNESELIGKKFLPLVNPDDQKTTNEKMKLLYQPPYTCYIEQRALTVKGWRWLAWNDKAILSAQNEIIEIIGVGRDITEQKEVEASLKESEKKFRQIAEGINELIWLRDVEQNKIIYVNNIIESMWEMSPDDFADNFVNFLNYVHPSDKKIVKKTLNGIRTDKSISEKTTYRIITSSGQIKWLQTKSYPIVEEDGSISKRIAVTEDITDIKTTNEKLDGFFRMTLDLIMLISENGKIEFTNDACKEILNYLPEELFGKSFLDFIHPDDITETIKKINQLLANNSIKSFAIRFRTKKETYRVLEWNAKNSGEYIFGVARDITETKEKEAELRAAKNSAEKAFRLKSEFLAQMSHEIRTPLNSVLNSAAVLKDYLGENPDDDILELFPIINSAGNRIIRTIDSIINMSELNLGTYEPIYKWLSLRNDIFKTIIGELNILAKNKGLEFKVIFGCENKKLYGDSYSLTQIFVNLIDNAIKYTNKGSVIVNTFLDDQNKLSVSISDTGIGMSEQFIPELFTAFRQEEQGYTRIFEGNGLGLALVKEYCNINDAQIYVQSKKGEGTTFTVKFNKIE